ncbi:Dolichyl-phosphate-mannose-protein mannosyltransferase [Geodermatophilus pulveris]|uniref:Dolichyl-phosphate-mannose-protein mannosyltransferase n=1 Tax=Geodermatophilus pulveris TaxID=1564159 RepID=A0A239BB19_9ACTN|nr:glycosyltransferase family 39 protein [Geodermatophilus pulveris]SNS05090.1 Dolichyl-phosphate-mannose-protein mannosyltransferase [Geodermatophilus pulveris]
MTASPEGAQAAPPATRVHQAPARPDRRTPRRPGLWTRLGERSGQPWPLAALAVVLAGSVVVGVLARFVAPPELWLDEAQSVAIASLPLPDLFAALEQDGSPPLYYLLLHAWTSVFGTSATAVRAMSAVIGVLTLPLAWHVARRLAGRRVAVALVVLLATSPFLIRYSSETRMYALLVLLTVLAAAAGAAVLRHPGPGPVIGLGVVTGALLLTHMWAFHVAAVAGLLALAALRSRRAVALRVLAGLAVGGLLFSPWLLSLLVQLAHTGTPWAAPPAFAVLPMALEAWRGGFQVRDHVLGTALLLLAFIGLLAAPTARRPGARTVLLAVPPRPSRAVLLAMSLGTLLVAGAVSALSGTAVADRYTSVAVLAFLALAALGLAALPGTGVRATGLVLVAGLGLWTSLPGLTEPRTQAGEVAQALEDAAPGDVVVFCPDQLGPAVARLVPPEQRLDLVVYPDLRPADRVDWTDYEARMNGTPSSAVAADVLRRAGDGSGVWVVTGPGYRVPSTQRCGGLVDALERARGTAEPVVTPDPSAEENHRLDYLAPVAG